jgi:hypothetical protein
MNEGGRGGKELWRLDANDGGNGLGLRDVKPFIFRDTRNGMGRTNKDKEIEEKRWMREEG